MVTDFYAAYNDFAGEHQRCWAHLLRDLHQLKEKHKESEQGQEVLGWATEVRKVRKVRKLYDQTRLKMRCGDGWDRLLQLSRSGKFCIGS